MMVFLISERRTITSWECHKGREFALRPVGDFLLVLDRMVSELTCKSRYTQACVIVELINTCGIIKAWCQNSPVNPGKHRQV